MDLAFFSSQAGGVESQKKQNLIFSLAVPEKPLLHLNKSHSLKD